MSAMSLESFIRSRADLSFEDAFKEFKATEPIQRWLGDDTGKEKRLREEFRRIWASMRAEGLEPLKPTGASTAPERENGPVDLTFQAHEAAQPEVHRPFGERMRDEDGNELDDALDAPPKPPSGGRAVGSMMCPNCGSMDIRAHAAGDLMKVRCRKCDAIYDNLLDLLPVKELGPFALLFGEGWQGAANAGGLLAAIIAFYGVLRWLL